jgi:hypothetical protein
MKKIVQIASIMISALSIIFLLYGSIKLARVDAATVPQNIDSGIPGVEIAQPSKVIGREDTQIIMGVAAATLMLGAAGYAGSSRKKVEDKN